MDTQGIHRERAAALSHAASLEAEIAAMVAASEADNADDEHDPEGATIAFERAQLLAVLGVARQRVADLDAALERSALGRYGVCDACGKEIASARLEARPAAALCIGCARRVQRGCAVRA